MTSGEPEFPLSPREGCCCSFCRHGYGCPVEQTDPNEKAAEFRGFSMLDFLRKTGAGEAIRTLDPNLGKVVLYP